jgi:hypothetical protein
MKKLFIILLFVCSLAQAQTIGRFPFGSAPVVSGGSNMISNGTFDSGTGWTVGANWTISTGEARWDYLGTSILEQQEADMITALTSNTSYTLEFDLTSAGNIYMSIYNSSEGSSNAYVASAWYSSGHKIVTFTTDQYIDLPGYYNGIRFTTVVGSESTCSIDNIELYETP